MRREDTRRKEARERRKARKEEEKLLKREEVKRLKALKLKELRRKLERIGREGGKGTDDNGVPSPLDSRQCVRLTRAYSGAGGAGS